MRDYMLDQSPKRWSRKWRKKVLRRLLLWKVIY